MVHEIHCSSILEVYSYFHKLIDRKIEHTTYIETVEPFRLFFFVRVLHTLRRFGQILPFCRCNKQHPLGSILRHTLWTFSCSLWTVPLHGKPGIKASPLCYCGDEYQRGCRSQGPRQRRSVCHGSLRREWSNGHGWTALSCCFIRTCAATICAWAPMRLSHRRGCE